VQNLWSVSKCKALRTSLSKLRFFSLLATIALTFPSSAFARNPPPEPCPAAVGASIESPPEFASRNGRLQVSLRLRNSVDSTGQMQYCYLDERGNRSPTLRVRPGDLLLLKLTNELSVSSATEHPPKVARANCTSATMTMTADATNLHFHGLSISPSCHVDDSLHTSIPPSAKAFLYRVRIPKNQPPGLYWYHPHPHGHSEEQVLGGASGALIVEGIGYANPLAAGLPERVLVIRDHKLASVAGSASNHDPSLPAKDLSINFIPVPYPEYPVAAIKTRPLTRELWRVLNASADTYVNLGVLFNGEWQASGLVAVHGSWQPLGLVAVDGVPISEANSSAGKVLWKTGILIPPGGRAEFVFATPPEGIKAELFTAGADTNPPADEDRDRSAATGSGSSVPGASADNDDYTPPRPLARIVASRLAVEPPTVTEDPPPVNRSQIAALATVSPVRQRTLYFSETVMDPKHPDTSTVFYITEEGHTPKAYDPSVMAPDIIVHQGDVEDWTIENRSLESHAFHIHQTHFLLVERDNEPASESYLLDTVDVPYWDGSSKQFPSVKLRMDFRDSNIVGTFPYHCHILQHVDGGMMGVIQVQPKLK
jgi:FtsP/CotA-like multicopper oxidase with cupredoxin domain